MKDEPNVAYLRKNGKIVATLAWQKITEDRIAYGLTVVSPREKDHNTSRKGGRSVAVNRCVEAANFDHIKVAHLDGVKIDWAGYQPKILLEFAKAGVHLGKLGVMTADNFYDQKQALYTVCKPKHNKAKDVNQTA